MPYYTRSPKKHRALVDQLVKELKTQPRPLNGPVRLPARGRLGKKAAGTARGRTGIRGKARGSPPIVIQEEQRVNHRLFVTVIWDAWAKIPEEDRGGVVLDAYAKAFGSETTSRVALATGVTTEEAETLGVA